MKINLKDAQDFLRLWTNTYCELANGWEDHWVVIWRNERFFSKISSEIKGKKRPSPERIKKVLITELKSRLVKTNKLNCDAKELAYLHFCKKELKELHPLLREIGEVCAKNADAIDKHLIEISDTVEGNILLQRVKDYIHIRNEINEFCASINYPKGMV